MKRLIVSGLLGLTVGLAVAVAFLLWAASRGPLDGGIFSATGQASLLIGLSAAFCAYVFTPKGGQKP